MKQFIAVLSLCLLTALCAADPVPKVDPAPVTKLQLKPLKFPELPLVPQPPVLVPAPPKIDTDAIVGLTKGQFYVIASPRPMLILTTGAGELDITERKPPFMLPVNVAIGWTADPKDKEFVVWGNEYQFLYLLKAAKTGNVTLVTIPAVNDVDDKGKQIPLTPKDILRRTLAVDDGTVPIPPKPIEPPKPVDPPIPNPATGLRVIFICETEANLTQEQLNITNSTKVIAYLNEKCAKDKDGRAEWRKWDKGTIDKTGLEKESALWQQLWKDVKPKLGKLPQIVIVNDQTGNTFDWPATEAEMLAKLKQFGG